MLNGLRDEMFIIVCFFYIPLIIITSCSEEKPTFQTTPITIADKDQLVEIFDTVYLNGTFVKIADDVEFIWTFDYKPEGSKASFYDSSSSNPYFIPNVAGFFNVQLVMKVGEKFSEPDFTTIQAVLPKSEEYFPNSVGSKWMYETSNSHSKKDTINFEIAGLYHSNNNEEFTIWVSDVESEIAFYNDNFDALFFKNEDTVFFYKFYENEKYSFLMYIIPFVVGETWLDNSAFPCRYFVIEKNVVPSIIADFDTGHLISERRGGANYYLTTFSWIVPYIGLIKKDIHEYDFAYQYEEHWELI